MHQQSSVAHQSSNPHGVLSRLASCNSGGQHWAAALRRLSCLSSLLGGAGESDQLARPGERASAAGSGWAGISLLICTWTLFRATAPRMAVLDGSDGLDGFRYAAQSGGYSTHAQK